jgi:uncharacterized repeat protein (TIGR02543 family)
MKKLILLSAMCILTMLFTNKAMSQVVASGTTGDCTWTLTGTSGNYTLTISGAGAMGDYSSSSNIPWYSYLNGIKTLDLQQGVTTIGNYAFYECSGLTSVTIPNSVTTIGAGAFYQCSGLTSVTIGNSVISIGHYAFYDCSGLTTVNFNATNCIFMESSSTGSPFQNCSSFTTLNIGNNVETIPANAFSGCIGLTSVTIPNSVTSIGDYAFSGCLGLTSVTIPNSVTSIGEGAFYQCEGLTSVTILNSVTTIGALAFSGCLGLTSVTIPNSVTSIGAGAFEYCDGLTSVTIPNSVTSIGEGAFAGCSGLTELRIKAQTPPALGNNLVFWNVPATIPVHVPCGKASAYQSASGWSNFSNYTDDLPLLNLSVQSNDATMGTATVIQSNSCTNNTAIIGATANQGYRFVQWNDGNTQTPRTITVTQDITYTAMFESVSAIADVEVPATVSIYPNPAADNIHIVLPEHALNALFTLYDMQGKALIRKEIGNRDVVSVSGLATGIYFYNVRMEKQNYQGKLIKQ